jgi:CDP-6-deoxy-D-xylo-4-hexulose-3-dehydrase
MDNNITEEDLAVLIDFLRQNPRLTQSENVALFEKEWSEWLGVKYSIFVNSGASANFATIAALKYIYGKGGEIIVPPLTWVSDISTVLLNGFTPVFADIDPDHLGMKDDEILSKVSDKTKAVFLTHIQGFNALTDKLLKELKDRDIPLIEDVCESHGALFNNKKAGTFGLISNFSFYFAHHMSTIEGGMVCTDDEDIYNTLRMLRSHGMTRELHSTAMKEGFNKDNPELSPDFIFAMPALNMRGTEIGGVLGRNQLKKLDDNNKKRRENLKLFLGNINSSIFKTDFRLEGSCSYAFPLIVIKKDVKFRDRLETALRDAGVEFRRGSSGGGNQLRQPYLKGIVADNEFEKYPNTEHIHFFGYYIGNYPALEKDKILQLCKLLNSVK